MRIRPLIVAAALSAMFLFAHQAFAFTVDEHSGTKPDGSPRYVDPDEQPSPFLFGAQGQNRSNDFDRNFGPAPPSNGSSQWLMFPQWLFSTEPPHK